MEFPSITTLSRHYIFDTILQVLIKQQEKKAKEEKKWNEIIYVNTKYADISCDNGNEIRKHIAMKTELDR